MATGRFFLPDIRSSRSSITPFETQCPKRFQRLALRAGHGLRRPEHLEQRLELLLNFEKIEQRLLLIGDWYTAQLYRLIVDEFYIDEWKAAVRGKLDQLERITEAVRENFTFSWRQFLDLVELGGWLLLLIGYFVLFILEAGRAK